MKDFGAWFNEQSPTGAQVAPQVSTAGDAPSAAGGASVGDPYLDAGVLGAGQLTLGRVVLSHPLHGQVMLQGGANPEPQVAVAPPLHMLLHGDQLDAEAFSQACTYVDVERWLEREAAKRWQVYPVDAVTAYADFSRNGGITLQRAYMYNFGLRADVHGPEQPSAYVAKELAQQLWLHLMYAWAPGAMVVWRARPKFTFYEGISSGWDALTQSLVHSEQPQLKVSLRLGALQPPTPGCRVAFKEGDFIPHVKDL